MVKNEDPRPQKSGEIFRDELGKFSFSCTYCNVGAENCMEIMDHINSHFDKENSYVKTIEMSTSLPLPEFVSIDELEPETKTETKVTSNDIFQKFTMCQPKSISAPSILKRKLMPNMENGTIKIKRTSEEPKISVVKIVRLKPIKLRPRQVIRAERNKATSKVDQNNSLTKRTEIPKIDIPAAEMKYKCSQSEVEPAPHELDSKSTVCVDNKEINYTTEIKKQVHVRHINQLKSDGCVQSEEQNVTENKVEIHVRDINQMKSAGNKEVNGTESKKQIHVRHINQLQSTWYVGSKEVIDIENKQQIHVSHINQMKSAGCVRGKEMNHTAKKKQVHVTQVNLSKCYQCKKEPKTFNPSDPKRHICIFCASWFPNHIELETHTKETHNKDANYHVWSNKFYCYVCKRKFPSRENFQSHMHMHNEHTEHLCATCGIIFKSFIKLRGHMRIHEERTYTCEECGKVFKRSDLLTVHRRCHTKELSFVCKICSKAYKMKRYLDRHMAVHNDVKINCRFCDASFNFVTVRNAHERSRHHVM